MFLLTVKDNHTPIIKSKQLILCGAKKSDFKEWQKLRLENKKFLTPFEPRWHKEDHSKKAFIKRINIQRKQSAKGVQFVFFIFEKNATSQQLVGSISLSNIRYGAAFHVNLGYWIGEASSNKGIMTRSVALILPFIFEELKLQRAHAACLVHNIASQRLLEKNGFEKEGYAKKYLQINGHWQDHVLYGLTKERYMLRRNFSKAILPV